MFYSKLILAKKGTYAYIWLAAHSSFQKLSKKEIYDTDILEAAGQSIFFHTWSKCHLAAFHDLLCALQML